MVYIKTVFDALFYGKIDVRIERDDNYYFVNQTRLPAEIFADISSMLADGDCREPLIKDVVDVFKKEFY